MAASVSTDSFMQECAEIIGTPLEQWPGNCFYIATQLVKKGVVEGEPVYGSYWGPIAPDSMFAGRDFCHHGWIENRDDNEIIDPTCWVFLNCKPYLHSTSLDDEAYDRGSNRVREMYMRPPPPFDPVQETKFPVPKELRPLIKNMLGEQYENSDRVCLAQAQWLASLPIHFLADKAEAVYRWVADRGWIALIPFDNRVAVLGADDVTPDANA